MLDIFAGQIGTIRMHVYVLNLLLSRALGYIATLTQAIQDEVNFLEVQLLSQRLDKYPELEQALRCQL